MNRAFENLRERLVHRPPIVGSWQGAHSMIDDGLEWKRLTPQEAMQLRELVERAGLEHVANWEPPVEHKYYPPLRPV